MEKQRENRLSLRLNDDMTARLAVISKSKGMPPATVAALAIADYVQVQERLQAQLHLQAQAVADAFKDSLPMIINMMALSDDQKASAEQAFEDAMAVDGEALANGLGRSVLPPA